MSPYRNKKEEKEINMKPMQAPKKIGPGSIVCIMLILLLVYLSTGGIWQVNEVIKSTEESVNLQQTLEGITGVDTIEMNLEDVDVVIHLVEEDKVEITKSVGYDEEQAVVGIMQKGHKILLESSKPAKKGLSWLLKFVNIGQQSVEISIPIGFEGDLKITTSSGDVVIEEPLQLTRLSITTVSGEIRLEEVEAPSQIQSKSGDIAVEKLVGEKHIIKNTSGELSLGEGQGDFEITTVSGDQQIGKIIGKNHKMSTTSGEIVIDALQGKYEVSSVSGDVAVENVIGYGKTSTTSGEVMVKKIELQGDLEVKTVSGEVHIAFTPKSSAKVNMDSKSGEILGNIPISYDNSRRNSATAELGTNMLYHVKIETLSGEIYIEQDA